jgi:two-component system chemotaxis response regulator CheB
MDGITFLRKVMAERPTPVVMCSTLTAAGANTTMQAMAEGAVGFVTKPKMGLRDFLTDPSNGLVATVRAAAQANVGGLSRRQGAASSTPPTPSAVPPALRPNPPPRPMGPAGAMDETTERVLAIGSSTGGVQAIEAVLTALPRTAPGVVIVQHMPESFTAAFAARLNGLCAMEVREARDGDRVMPGRVLIAPGSRHMQLVRSGAQYLVTVRDGPLVNRHKPSVDVLLRSVAQHAGRNAVGVILTGMRQAGAATAAQDEASCVVFGMPKEAVRLGAADVVLPLGEVAGWLLRMGQPELST